MLQHLRETAHLNQRDLAQRAGISQETVSQLETGKSARPRLETLTKLRDALELGDMRPEDLLNPSPLASDPELAPAAARLITLLKVLPIYRYGTFSKFWTELSSHLGYQDLYPATHLSAHLEAAIAANRSTAEVELAAYTLMFFDPDDAGTLQILTDHSGIGPERQVAYRWCRDVTDAAWILHRAAMTSYPEQVGQLYAEAIETTDPQRLRELCGSVYDIVRSRAFPRATVEEQITALRSDPSDEVHYTIAKNGGADIQHAALKIPTAWPGLSLNTGLTPAVAEQLLDTVLDALTGRHAAPAGKTLHNLSERADLPRPLLERISSTIDRDVYPDIEGGWVTAAVIGIRNTLDELDHQPSDTTPEHRPSLHAVADQPAPTAWWRRFFARS
ncbi:helix-turn-helix domain-containing protein (plasmid) [Saccharothrix sp. AJ9571]|nr:helix-turn-helix domain-containing protein [Saccharothrix sp. AJ9571]